MANSSSEFVLVNGVLFIRDLQVGVPGILQNGQVTPDAFYLTLRPAKDYEFAVWAIQNRIEEGEDNEESSDQSA